MKAEPAGSDEDGGPVGFFPGWSWVYGVVVIYGIVVIAALAALSRILDFRAGP